MAASTSREACFRPYNRAPNRLLQLLIVCLPQWNLPCLDSPHIVSYIRTIEWPDGFVLEVKYLAREILMKHRI